MNTLVGMTSALAVTFLTAGALAQPAVDDVLTRVGDRVAEFYERAKSVVCLETYVVQPIDSSYSSQGFARTVESELRIEVDRDQAPGEARVLRKIRKVNGRAPRDEDKKRRSGCTDPIPLTEDPLAFLLPRHRSEYQFSAAGTAKVSNRSALMIDFSSVNRRSDPELIKDPGGHEDCFDWSGHVATRGRIWVDRDNFDVLRVERGLRGPVDVRVPAPIQRRYLMDNRIAILRDDVTIRYATVAFRDPDEVVLLPESITSVTVIRGGLQSTRRMHRFSDYKRFVTAGRLLQ